MRLNQASHRDMRYVCVACNRERLSPPKFLCPNCESPLCSEECNCNHLNDNPACNEVDWFNDIQAAEAIMYRVRRNSEDLLLRYAAQMNMEGRADESRNALERAEYIRNEIDNG